MVGVVGLFLIQKGNKALMRFVIFLWVSSILVPPLKYFTPPKPYEIQNTNQLLEAHISW